MNIVPAGVPSVECVPAGERRAHRKAVLYSDRTAKPPVPAPDLDAVPDALRAERRWVLWALEWRAGAAGKPGKWAKPPLTVNGGKADTTDPATWSDFEAVARAYRADPDRFAGAGFVLGAGWAGIDLDDVRDPDTGELTPEAAKLIERVGTCAEVSPSGTGAKLIGRGQWPGAKHRYRLSGGGEIEIYDTGRYFTVTGHRIAPHPVNDVTGALRELATELDGAKAPALALTGGGSTEGDAADDELIARATAATNGAKFLALWRGEWGDAPSASEADFALCSLLAFWTGPDPARIDRLFRRSGLMRPKWDEVHGARTYGAGTIARVIETRTEYHTGAQEPDPDAPGADEPAKKGKGEKPKAPSAADVLVNIARGACELWHDAKTVAYATIGRTSYPVRSRDFRLWLVGQYFDIFKSAPNADAIGNALTAIEAAAVYRGPECEANVRVAGHGGSIYLDLADAQARAVEIDSAGWRLCEAPPVRFVKKPGMKALPEPVTGGGIGELRQFVRANDDGLALLVAWLTAALRPTGPYPVLVLSGEQGSAKSTTSRALRTLIDPSAAPLRAEPKEPRDLAVGAANNRVLALDNVSHVPAWLSDALCRLATGGGFATRGLYTDDEERVFDAVRPVILNGIPDFVDRGDLAERALLARLNPIPQTERVTEGEFWARFGEAHPRLLGALLDRVSAGLRELPNVQLDELPRMADFARWSVACERGAGEAERFVTAYGANAADAAEQALEAEPLADVLRTYLGPRTEVRTTAAGLLVGLEAHVRNSRPDPDGGTPALLRARAWPRNAIAMAGKLRRIAPALRAVADLDIQFTRSKTERSVTLTRLNRHPLTGGVADPTPQVTTG